MLYVYLLKSLRTGEFYSGRCDSTKNRLPLELVHVELCSTREEARRLEKFFKSGYGREIIREIAK